MIKEVVEVVGVLDKQVKIKFNRKAACGGCMVTHVCGKGEGEMVIDNCGFSLESGERVEIGIDEKMTLLSGLIMFLIPAILLILGLIIFKNRGEASSFFLALGMVCIYYIIVKIALKNKGKKFNVQILRKV